jgi:para-nitrobenzyl esterase
VSRRAFQRLGVVLAMVVAAAPAGSGASAPMTKTRIAQGELRGLEKGEVTAFLGVPFAAPPTGERRWQPPRPPQTWAGIRQADHFGPSCEQTVTPGGFGPWTAEYVVSGDVSEDCLFLNIWTPASSPRAKLPVLVWIHGGAFTSGSGSVPIYDGTGLGAKGIVVVTINYRVGVYGFLAHPQLTAESPAHASGNYGLLDQVEALRWIHANIGAFGGDPTRVTIAGQSAGAAAVHHLIATPLAKGLFHRAIAQSGSGMGLAVPDRVVAEESGTRLAQAAGVRGIAELRALSPQQLADALKKMAADAGATRFAPIVDGLLLPDAKTVGANTNDTPILTGMTAHEMVGLNPNAGKTTPETLRAQIEKAYGASASDVLALYPAADDAAANAAAEALARDRGLASTYLWARQREKVTRQPIYLYLWTHTEPGPDAARYKAFHSSEIPYVFETLGAAPRPFADEDYELAVLMSSYWANWTKKGDPNGDDLPRWPQFGKTMLILEIGSPTHARPILGEAARAAFEKYVQSGGKIGLF